MTRPAWLVGVALVGVVWTGASVHAEGDVAPNEPQAPAARPRLGMSLGLLTPFGELGLEYAQPLGPMLEIGAGLGVGLAGVQGFVMPRLHGSGARFFDVGLGVSLGRVQEPEICFSGPGDCGAPSSAVALWANLEVGWTKTWDQAFVRIFGGAGRIVLRGQCSSGYSMCGPIETGLMLPSLGMTVGMRL
jgi:hypothetical protein